VQDRLSLAAANGFAGVAVWRLGQEDPAVWQTTPLGGPGV
jgi:spore germination protein YaaH